MREARILSLAERILRQDAHLYNCHVSCRIGAGTLVLEGRVGSYYYKQIAQTIVADLDGVERVLNEIEVT